MIRLLVFGLCLASPPCQAVDNSLHPEEPIQSSSCLPDPLPESPPNDYTWHLALGTNWTKLEYSVYYNCYDELVEELDHRIGDLKNKTFREKQEIIWSLQRSLETAIDKGHIDITRAFLERRDSLLIPREERAFAYPTMGQPRYIWIEVPLLDGEYLGGRVSSMAAGNNDVELLKLLIDAGANFTRSSSSRDFGLTPLFAAAKGG